MCTASKTHVDCAFQVSAAMKVTCSCEWSDRHAEGIFKPIMLQHPVSA